MKKINLQKGEILVLRTSDKDGRSYGDFQYPKKGEVVAPDWDGQPECGGGLHGLPRGCGDATLMNWEDGNTAQLIAVNPSENYFEFAGKCKFKSGRVVFSKINGLREAIDILSVAYPDMPVVGRAATAGNRGTATAGYAGTATAGNRGTATAGDAGTATAGDEGTIIVKWWDGKRYRASVGYIGENGIEANKKYRVDKGEFIPVEED